MKRSVIPTLAAVVLLSGCTTTPSETPIETALAACQFGSHLDNNHELADAGRTLTLDAEGTADVNGLSPGNITCILNQLDAPESVRAKMNATRAVDGQLSDSWGDITATWTYHPDDGLNLILELE